MELSFLDTLKLARQHNIMTCKLCVAEEVNAMFDFEEGIKEELCKLVYSIYLSNKAPKLKIVTGADEEGLNVRKKRNTKKNNKPIACIKNGTRVKVYGTRLGWSKISPDSEAWVFSKYLK